MRLRTVVQLTRLAFSLDGVPVEVDIESGESLLTVLRERFGITTVKDGCAPQGQCGCCTVLVDGDARVSCVTPALRVDGRAVTTLAGLPTAVSQGLAEAFVATGGSQCGFCTPGILMRLAALHAKGRTGRTDLDRALAAHLCRCTGWQTIYEAAASIPDFFAEPGAPTPESAQRSGGGRRDLVAAGRRAELEGGGFQRVGIPTPLGDAGFADDTAPRNALVAVPHPQGSDVETVTAAGMHWVIGDTPEAARLRAGKVQGRRTTVEQATPFSLPDPVSGGIRLATGWVEPGYLEPDASWCEPGGEPVTTLANGGAFGGKLTSAAPAAARELAAKLDAAVRVVYAREDVARLGPKRPPIAATAVAKDGTITIDGVTAFPLPRFESPYALDVDAHWRVQSLVGPPVSDALRAVGLAEHTVLVEGAIEAAGLDRSRLVDNRGASVLMDTLARAESGALAGARVTVDDNTGGVTRIAVRVAAGDPLDAVVMRSYAIGAAHMALGWVLTEGIAVDPETGEALDLTIRSLGIIRPKSMPPVEIEIIDDPGAPLARSSDAVFAAVAAAAWNAITGADGARPETFPAGETRAARMLRR